MSLPVEAIISPEPWAEDLATRSGEDGIINYAIISKAGQYARNNYGVSSPEAAGIRSVFAELDTLTGVSFAESSPEDADIILYSVKKYRNRNWVGLTEDTGAQYVATWQDFAGKRLTPFEVSVIKHEIGHTLGLDHPYGDGYYEGVTTQDTIMSYNDTRPVATNYSPLDVQALQLLWGAPT
ncbi:hypothetical protein KUL97_04455 [Synechococcus sp. HK05]|uniref:reprolysin-like metallopeptidase n=1 Tax=Synechococcus sp. HK05 TaxID=2725975 RepID=UPI001C38458D|nr:hypothetical protein [Synechococcus sp. HK05]MBV2350959.1 hypothetical protein [Synechococcus sp. HK05]